MAEARLSWLDSAREVGERVQSRRKMQSCLFKGTDGADGLVRSPGSPFGSCTGSRPQAWPNVCSCV